MGGALWKCRDQNGRIQYGYLYGRTYEAVKKKKLAVLCQNNLQNSPGKCYVFRNLSEEWMLSMRYAVKLSTYACYETLLDTHILPEFGDMPLKYISSASVYAFSEKLKQQGLSPRTIKIFWSCSTVFYAMVKNRGIWIFHSWNFGIPK